MTPLEACEDLYINQVVPALKNEAIDRVIKSNIACRYVEFMVDVKSGKLKNGLRSKYQEIINLIKGGKTDG